MPDILGSIHFTWPFYTGFALAYLLGSIPFGFLLTRFSGLGDIRAIGSGSIGATNVLRTGNKSLAALTVILDGGKGAVAVLIAAQMGPDMLVFAAVGVVLGHLFPVWLKFRGGKGVATAFGVLLAASWPVGLLAGLTWLAMAVLSRVASISSLLAAAAAPLYAWWLTDPQRTEVFAALALLVWISHWSNIKRLIKGEEPRISFNKAAKDGE
jgi:glycerol-3-phosphate acyltransferase PlsY